MLPRHTSITALPGKSPATSAPTTHTKPSFELVLKLFQKITHYLSVTFGKEPGLPNVSACDWWHRTSSHRCGAGRFAALPGTSPRPNLTEETPRSWERCRHALSPRGRSRDKKSMATNGTSEGAERLARSRTSHPIFHEGPTPAPG